MKKNGTHFETPLIISLLLTIFLIFVVPAVGLATDYYVKTSANGGSDSNSGLDWDNAKASIGSAMSLVDGGDAIYVAAGQYNEKVTFHSSNNNQIIGGYLESGGGTRDPWTNVTIIDGATSASTGPMVAVPYNSSGAGYYGFVIDGFTITNGTDTASNAGGIQSWALGLTIRDCVIENNSSAGYAGGIHISCGHLDNHSGPVIQNCIIRNNTSSAGVGGINFEGAGGKSYNYNASLINCLIYGNSATGSGLWAVGGIDVLYPAGVNIANCTIANNTVTGSPTYPIPGIRVIGYSDYELGQAFIKNSIIWHAGGDDLYVDYSTGYNETTYSDIEDTGDSGTGVIHTNPAFAGTSDFHLTASSGGCIDGGTASGAPLTDLEGNARPEGSGYDMGAYEYSAPAEPDITVADLSVSFGDVTVGESTDATVTITNDGSQDLDLGVITDPDAPFTLVEACSGQTLAPGATCDCTVSFSPTAAESSTGSFTIPSNDPDENPVTVALSGTGTPAPQPDIAVSDNKGTTDDLDVPFGNLNIGESAEATITITNDGNADLDLGTLTGLDAPFSILEACSGGTLAPGATCDSTVTFSPTATGEFTDSLSIPSNDPDETPVTVTISGNGITPVVQYTLTTVIDPAGGGTVTLDPAGGTYDEGSSVSLTGIAGTGYIFDGWDGDVSDADAETTTTTMNADKIITAVFLADGDGDGVPSEVEYGPDEDDPDYDGDGSGTPDSDERNVVSGHTYDEAYYVTLAVPVAQSLLNVDSTDNPSPDDSPEDVTFPYGFLEFTITGVGSGNSTTATIYLPDGEEPTTYWKYGPTPDDNTDHWYEFIYDGSTGAEFNGNVITLHFVDGERGDDDLTENGVVIDIGAPGDDSSSKNSNCFIGTMFY